MNVVQNILAPMAMPARQLAQTIRHYRPRQLRADLVAGLTVAVVDVPQSMAYAFIAGVPPQYGLYTSIAQGAIAALFASNNHLACGATNTQSLLIAATVAPIVYSTDPGNGMLYLQLVISLTLIKGLIQIAFAVAQMGSLVRYVSRSVIIGFAAGAGVLIAVGQLPHFLGLAVKSSSQSPEAWGLPGVLGAFQEILPALSEANVLAVGMGLTALAIALGVRAVSKLLPGPLLAVVVPAAVVYLAGWAPSDLRLVPELPQGLPALALPSLSWLHVEALLSGAFALALLGMIETVSIGKSLAVHSGTRINANQEFFAQGLANVVGSFFQNIPGSGSFTRSALNFMAGGQTRLAGVYSSAFVAAILLLFAPMTSYIPLASLAGILFVVAFSLIDWRTMLRIARTSRSDAAVCFITFASTLLIPLDYAIYVGIFLNIALYLRKASHLHLAEMVPSPGGPFMERPIRDRAGERKVIFLQIEGDLFFGLADELQDHLTTVANSGVRVVILRLKRTLSIDSTVLSVFEQFIQQIQARGGHVLLCGVRPDLLEHLRSFGLIQQIGEDNVFESSYGVFTSAKRALHRARTLVGSSLDMDPDLADDAELEHWAYQI